MVPTAAQRPHIREATRDDTAAVCALLAASAQQVTGEAHHAPRATVDPAAHDWLYWDNPFGPPRNLVWEQDGRIVAHAGMYVTLGQVDGVTVRVGRTSHAVTDRAFRGQGLFGSLARRQQDHLGPDIDLLVALPTAAAVAGLAGAGVVQRERALRWFRPIEDEFTDLTRLPLPLASAMTRVAFGPRPTPAGEVMGTAPSGLDDLAAHAVDDGPLADAAWWRWRFEDNPIHVYQRYVLGAPGGRVDAAIAVRPARYFGAMFLQVLHWQARDEESAGRILGRALESSSGCVAATLLATDGSQVAEWARRCGMRRLPALVDDTSGPIAIADGGRPGGLVHHRRWSVSLASHHDR